MSDTNKTKRHLTTKEMDALLAVWVLIELRQAVQELFNEFDRLVGEQ